MKKIYIIRHGETDWNVSRKFQGQSDIPLNENGRLQAAGLTENLQEVLPFDRVVATDLSRAIETAEIIVRGHATPVETEPGFREIDFGEWEGLNAQEIEARWPGELEKWFTTGDLNAPDGETLDKLYQRVWLSFLYWAEKTDYEKMAIVCHGGSGSALVCAILGEPPQAMHKYMLRNAGILVVNANTDGTYALDPASTAPRFMRD